MDDCARGDCAAAAWIAPAARRRARRAPDLLAQRASPSIACSSALSPGRTPRARGARGSLRARRGRGRPPAGSSRDLLPRRSSSARDRAERDLQLVAKALHAPAHAHQLASLERPGEQVGVAERARADRAGAVAQLDRQVWRARTRYLTFLARAREHAPRADVLGAQRRDPLHLVRVARCGVVHGCGHSPMMYGGSDAAAHMGPPSGWAQSARDDLRIPGLERRRGGRVQRGVVPRRLARRATVREP